MTPTAPSLTPDRQSLPSDTGEGRRLARAVLQRHLAANIRQHWVRSTVRVSVLAAADLAVYWGIRSAAWSIRGWDLERGGAMHAVFPWGFLGGWRFAWALILSLCIVGAYGQGDARRDSGKLFAGAALAALISLFAPAWNTSLPLTTVRFVAVVVLFGSALVVSRRAVDWVVRRVRPNLTAARALVIVGGNANEARLRETLERTGAFTVCKVLQLGDTATAPGNPVVRDIGHQIHACEAACVVIWGRLSDEDFARTVDASLASGCLLLAGAPAPAAAVQPRVVWIGGQQLLELTPPTLRSWQLAVKRALDLLGATAAIILTAPLNAVIALAILWESGRPVLFRQLRIGRGGSPFQLFKFRSMVVDAEHHVDELRGRSIYGDGRLFKVIEDPRATRVGRILRRTSLDELPQLINVLQGDMSLVGPRPPLPSEVSAYEEHHFCRLDVKPGITGPWQVSGRNTITDFEEVVRLESLYVRRWSLLTDLRILLKTVPVVLKGRGAH